MIIHVDVAMAAEQEGEHRHIESRGEPQDHGCDDDIDHAIAVPSVDKLIETSNQKAEH